MLPRRCIVVGVGPVKLTWVSVHPGPVLSGGETLPYRGVAVPSLLGPV